MRKLALASFILAPFAFAEAQAQDYRCTAVPNSLPLLSQAWNQRCIPYYIHAGGTLLDGELRAQLIQQSFQVWSAPSCTDLTFAAFGYTEQAPGFDPTRSDNQNIVISIENEADARALFTRDELAITITSFNTATGEIFDADILINAFRFPFDDVPSREECESRPTPHPYDLRNMLVHEIGHFIGFEHGPNEESTMFASAPECETKKRDLTLDDTQGVCDVYATAQPTRTCAPPASYEQGAGNPKDFRNQCKRAAGELEGCACTSMPASASVWLVWIGALFFLRARRGSEGKISGR